MSPAAVWRRSSAVARLVVLLMRASTKVYSHYTMADHSSRNPQSSRSIYAPLDRQHDHGAQPGTEATWVDHFEHWLRKRGLSSFMLTVGWWLQISVIGVCLIGFFAAGLYALGAIFSTSHPTSFEKESVAKADVERAAFLDPQTGAAEIERRMRAEIKYQDGTLLIGQDGFPEIAVSASSPWAVECNVEGLKVHIMMATEDSAENGGNGLYLSSQSYSPEQCAQILPVMVSTIKAIVVGK
jgi:hypothetical protein